MSLNWNTEAVINSEPLFKEEGVPDILLETAIFLCLHLGVGTLTKKTYKEWYRRAWLWEAVHGATRTNGAGIAVFFTEAEVYRLIGLKTNADTFPRSKFAKTLQSAALENAIKLREFQYGHRLPG